MTDSTNMPFGYAANTGGAYVPQADMLMSRASLKLPGHTRILPADITGFVDILGATVNAPPNHSQIRLK